MPHGDRQKRQTIAITDDLLHPARSDMDEWSAVEPSARVAPRLSVLGEMTGGVAHDFRNILAVIDSCLRLAERNLDEPERLLSFMAGAREGVTRGLRLTSQLLAFAQRGEMQTCAADANLLLKNLEFLLRCGAGSSVRVVFDLCPTIPDCLVNPSQFSAAILNLVINARDAMPNGGEVRISTARCDIEPTVTRRGDAGIYVRVRIQDDGVGMPEQVAKRISEPFFTTKGEEGTGLGVSQVCSFMHHIGGHVSVASEQSRGTTFDLLFPAIVPEIGLPHAGRGEG
jgi:signal transduction histidine kinase